MIRSADISFLSRKDYQMDKLTYNNTLRTQCFSLPDLCADQIDGVKRGLLAIPTEMLKTCSRIIVTGCGDSYVAAKASIPAFEKFGGRSASYLHERTINAARYLPLVGNDHADTLVIVVSCSGAPTRIQEVLRRANEHGCQTLAVTNNLEGHAAKEAKYALLVNTPTFPNASPGLRNYYASIVGLYLLAAAYGEARQTCPVGSVDAMAQAIAEYTQAYRPLLEGYDDQMFALAKKWKDCASFDLIGDDNAFCSAFFIAAKFAEVAGSMTNIDDAENWCHLPFFQKNPDRIGTILVAEQQQNDRSRIRETVHQAAGIGRPVLLIADGTKEEFGITEDIAVCTVPAAPAEFEFVSALMQYIPGSLLAGYVSTLLHEPFFRGRAGVFADPGRPIFYSNVEVVS